jgi:hypothetical protein
MLLLASGRSDARRHPERPAVGDDVGELLARLRTQAIGFAYSISVAVFGGTAPYLNQLLISIGVGWITSIYIMMLCVCTGVAVYQMPETQGIDLMDA